MTGRVTRRRWRFISGGAALSGAEVAATIEESVSDSAAAGYGIWLILRQGRLLEQDRPAPAGISSGYRGGSGFCG